MKLDCTTPANLAVAPQAHRRNARGRRRLAVLQALALAAAAAAVGVLLHVTYRAEAAGRRAVMTARAQTLLDALRAGIFAQGRMGHSRGDRLTIIFEELADGRDVLALALQGPDGVDVARGGDAASLPGRLDAGTSWLPGRLLVVRPIDFAAECSNGGAGRGRGFRGGAEALGLREGLYRLAVVLDTAELEAALRRDRRRVLLYAAILGAALLFAVSTLALLRRRSAWVQAWALERETAQRQARAARLGAGLAHETKNPLGIVRGLAQAIGENTEGCEADRLRARQIVDEVDRVIGGINGFLALSRPPEADAAPVDLDALFRDLLPLVGMDAAAAGVRMDWKPCAVHILADEPLLRRALLNLILNALRASRAGQAVRIEAARDGQYALLRVADEGCGIAAEDLPRVTEPYFTRFPGGTGLGLAVVEQIAAAHGWSLKIDSKPGCGTCATLGRLRTETAE